MRNERLIVVSWRLMDFGVNSLGNLAILRICSCLARDRYCNTIFTTWFIEISSSFSRLKRWPWWAWTFQDELSKLHKPCSRTPIMCCFQLTLSFDSNNFLGPHWLRIVSVYSLRPNLCNTASLTRTLDGNWEYYILHRLFVLLDHTLSWKMESLKYKTGTFKNWCKDFGKSSICIKFSF